MSNNKISLKIFTLGPFQATFSDGKPLDLKGAKNQALLALLALSPNMSRPRRWLEDKLWSTFGAEQAGANLRQSLSKIRHALGDQKHIVKSDRTNLSLDADLVWVDLIHGELPLSERIELLEGMDSRDQEFEDWLRLERQELQSRIAQTVPQNARGILINYRLSSEDDTRSKMSADMIANQIGTGIAEQVRAWLQTEGIGEHERNMPPSDIQIDCQLVDDIDGPTVMLKAIHTDTGRLLSSAFNRLDSIDEIIRCEDSVSHMTFEFSDKIIGKLPQVLDNSRPESRATALSRLGMYRMFSFERDSLREALSMWSKAYEYDSNPVYLAWSAMAKIIQLMETAEDDPEALREEALELHHKALEQAEGNALILALAAKVRGGIFREANGSMELAELSLKSNPASAYGLVTMAEAQMIGGNSEKAFEYSSRARHIARSSPFKHWWDNGHCVMAIACNRNNEAIEAAEAAARAAPISRPAHRHLLALYASEGQLDRAQEVSNKLAKIEPGFTLDRMVNDESYPVRTLRKHGLLEPVRALL